MELFALPKLCLAIFMKMYLIEMAEYNFSNAEFFLYCNNNCQTSAILIYILSALCKIFSFESKEVEFKRFISNLYYTSGITPKRVTSGGVHFCGIAPGNQSPKKRRSSFERLTTLSDSPARESNLRPLGQVALSSQNASWPVV